MSDTAVHITVESVLGFERSTGESLLGMSERIEQGFPIPAVFGSGDADG